LYAACRITGLVASDALGMGTAIDKYTRK
jgi:hypothetical protein